jgi:hypothetical protein
LGNYGNFINFMVFVIQSQPIAFISNLQRIYNLWICYDTKKTIEKIVIGTFGKGSQNKGGEFKANNWEIKEKYV